MAFKKGDPKPEGSGMKKGQKTRRTISALEIFDEREFCPIEKAIDRLEKCGKLMDDVEYINACLKLAKFRYAELKSFEHTIDPRKLPDDELLKKTAKLLNEAMEAKS